MKRVGSLALALVLALVMLTGVFAFGMSAPVADAAAKEKLVVYNWGDYIDMDVIDSFKTYYQEQTGKSIDVVYSTFDTNEIMLTTLEKGDEIIDLICPSEYAIQRLMQKGLIDKLDKSKLTNIANIDSMIFDKVDSVFNGIKVSESATAENMSDYFVPYMWGTLGILYNSDVVTEDDLAKGYGLLWNAADNKKLKGKILMKDSIRDSYVAAVLYLKETGKLPAKYTSLSIEELINTVDADLLNVVQENLIEQGKVIKGYEVDFGKGQMTSGRAYVDLAWSGDALWAMEDADNLDYFVPEIGGNIWFDGWVMPKTAANKEAAYMFMDYLCRPEIAIKNSMEIGYTCAVDKEILRANAEVCEIIEDNDYEVDEYFDDEIRYPVATDKLGVMKDFGDMSAATVSMWETVKSSNQSLLWILWVVIGVVGAAGIGLGIYFFVTKKKSVRKVTRRNVRPVAASQSDVSKSEEEDDENEEDDEDEE